ncbi:hypothetical protein FO519_004073 [Halicephalobus sp. NKZ332]|nr:hypothetical protein FO519_004073 [Halicephalobus sp. NKZ332]
MGSEWLPEYEGEFVPWWGCVGKKVLQFGAIPKHVAFILDGNRRFAKTKNLGSVIRGHAAGFERITKVLDWCRELGIKEVTLYAFSIENFKRTEEEVGGLMKMAKEKFEKLLDEKEKLEEKRICFRFFGKRELLPKDLQKLMIEIEEFTKDFGNGFVNVCLAYTSREEITSAMNDIRKGIKEGLIEESDIDEKLFSSCLNTGESLPIDILIRTTILLMVALYTTISMRSHLGVAMVCMVNATAVKDIALREHGANYSTPERVSTKFLGIESPFNEEKCYHPMKKDRIENVDNGYKGTFIWSNEQQSLLFSAGFYGNLMIMFFSGFLVDRFGPIVVGLVSMIGMTITVLLVPLVAHSNYYLFFVLRIIFGVFENPILPALSDVVARWFPATERSTVAAFYTSGNQLSASLGVVISSKFCEIDFSERWPSMFFLSHGGWPLIFYLAGGLGIIWIVFWKCFATTFPSGSKFLSREEKDFLYETNEKNFTTFKQRKESGLKMPLKKMVFSTATLAVVMAQFSFNFSNTMMQTYLPTFLRDVMNLDLNENGFYTAVPFFVQLFSKNILGNISDFLKKKKILTASSACRLFQSLASFGAAVIFIVMAFYLDCTTPNASLILLAMFGFCFGGAIPGSFTSSLCIAPNYTGMIASFTLIAGAIGSIFAPSVVAFIVKQGTKFEWSIVFVLVSLVNIFGGIIFFIYGTAKVQPWAKTTIPSNATKLSMNRGGKNRNNAHNSPNSLWIIIHGKVYDVTKFQTTHPGGEEILREVAGTDASKTYDKVDHSMDAKDYMLDYLIGKILEDE